ncbi:MAG TPA: phosphoribosylaminoimidazolesuccinocarboxamide synthase [Anaerohalosphaeraceae bacterium]|nr:phosphoribosylaminoimidazolesuccinocarboxamide synthase [Anaerohalosphaeraceae bacterium]
MMSAGGWKKIDNASETPMIAADKNPEQETNPMPSVIMQTNIPGVPVRRGKVRDIYDLGDKLLIAATDRISAFDVIMKTGIPCKGQVLTQISKFWFDFLADTVENHLISVNIEDFPQPFRSYPDQLAGRSMLVKKTQVLPIECVVRGYLAGSAWKEYQQNQTVCGIQLPAGLRQCEQLPEPIFTPATKAEQGRHDENISFEQCAEILGRQKAEFVRNKSVDIFKKAGRYARTRGIILADTKFEWGIFDGRIILIDEVLTPDSSRFWPADTYQPGRDQESFDKQFVRNYLEKIHFNKSGPGVELPEDIVQKTSAKYIEAYERLTGRPFSCV